MNLPTQITVYSFYMFEHGFESARVSPCKATRQAILDTFLGDPIESTAEAVEPEALDARGCYRRLPTGWGALN
ncbi:MAG: hypothetical protein Q8K96_18735 [Rubrivivax sp.]|nr:hypothetical protein [Rubrivivax sp.]